MLNNIANAIDSSAISTLFKTHFWIVPTAQSFHIMAVALVFTTSTIIALRAVNLAVGSSPTLPEWSTRLMPTLWGGLVALLLTGICLIIAEPHRELLDTLFQFKMLGVIIAAGMSYFIANKIYADAVTSTIKILAWVLILLWVSIIYAGRWIAYL